MHVPKVNKETPLFINKCWLARLTESFDSANSGLMELSLNWQAVEFSSLNNKPCENAKRQQTMVKVVKNAAHIMSIARRAIRRVGYRKLMGWYSVVEFLNNLLMTKRIAFQMKTTPMYVADGNKLVTQGSGMCTITVAGRSILEAVYAADISLRAIIRLSAMNALEFCMNVAGIVVVGSRASK